VTATAARAEVVFLSLILRYWVVLGHRDLFGQLWRDPLSSRSHTPCPSTHLAYAAIAATRVIPLVPASRLCIHTTLLAQAIDANPRASEQSPTTPPVLQPRPATEARSRNILPSTDHLTATAAISHDEGCTQKPRSVPTAPDPEFVQGRNDSSHLTPIPGTDTNDGTPLLH